MLGSYGLQLFRRELDIIPIITKKLIGELISNNLIKNKKNKYKLQNTDDIKYYNQNYKIKSEVNWDKEW
jgi:hypothetical protein|tara:strand:- start:1219 stop:1425 length:207 start_codon:yes stop_codon:yes gene_type:complete